MLSKDCLGKLFLFLWAFCMATIITFQMAGHLLAMPLPKEVERVRLSLFQYHDGESWLYVHTIYDQCSCTKLLLSYLENRSSMNNANELILFIGSDSSKKKDS